VIERARTHRLCAFITAMPTHWLANAPILKLSPRGLLPGDLTARSAVAFAEALFWCAP
jgi:hypothetical protein